MNDMEFCFDIKCISGFKRIKNKLIIYQKYGEPFIFDNEKVYEMANKLKSELGKHIDLYYVLADENNGNNKDL